MTDLNGATNDGTQSFAQNFPDKNDAGFYRNHSDLLFSTIGLGTYLGDANDTVDDRYETAIQTAVSNGLNVIDTAINYRFQRSERVIGKSLHNLFDDSEYQRKQIIVSTKGGFVPFEESAPEDPLEFIQDEFIDPGVATPEDFTQNGHCMTPDYIENQFQQSLDNLNLDAVDVYYVHNPEAELTKKSPEAVYDQLGRVFEKLEEFVDQGKLSYYGIATWEGLRVDPRKNEYLQLEKIEDQAQQAASGDHHFKAIQMPLNLGMSEALTKANQPVDEEPLTPLEAARKLGLMVFSSASILQGRLASNLPDEIRQDLKSFESDVHRAIQFARSCPGVTTSLVGMSDPDHVTENLELGTREPFEENVFRERFLEEV